MVQWYRAREIFFFGIILISLEVFGSNSCSKRQRSISPIGQRQGSVDEVDEVGDKTLFVGELSPKKEEVVLTEENRLRLELLLSENGLREYYDRPLGASTIVDLYPDMPTWLVILALVTRTSKALQIERARQKFLEQQQRLLNEQVVSPKTSKSRKENGGLLKR